LIFNWLTDIELVKHFLSLSLSLSVLSSTLSNYSRQVDRMDDETLKQVFKSLHADITNDVNPDKLIDVLYSKNLIGDGDYSDLWEVSDSRKRCRSLLLLLQRSSRTETFTHVREALRDEYPWIVDKIDAQLASLTAQQQHLSRSTDGTDYHIL